MDKLLDAYHSDNPNAPRFRVIASGYGFHIVPADVRDENGDWSRAITPLDSIISVPEEDRMASEHMKAIVEATARASGIRLGLYLGPPFNGLYAANGLTIARNQPVIPHDPKVPVPEIPLEWKRPYMFRWGASQVSARDALISLLSGSATTLRWGVGCGPNPDRAKTECTLIIDPIEVKVPGPDGQPAMQQLQFDRCLRCPPLPALPAPAAQKR
jgi:hypothetical protein